METTGTKTLMMPGELAMALKVSVRTVRRLRSQHRISCIFVTPTRPRFSFEQVLSELNGENGGGSDNGRTEVLP